MEEEKKDQAILEDNDDDIPNTNVPIDFEECAVTDNPPEQAELDEKDDEPVEPSAADTDTKVAPDDDSKQGEKKEPDDPDDDADNGKSGTPRGVQKRIDQLRRKAIKITGSTRHRSVFSAFFTNNLETENVCM